METIRSITSMQKRSRELAARGKKIGLVPTMGFLHRGHQSLIERAAKLADVVVTSIFVNPAQFGPNEDFEAYPRDEKQDIEKIRQALGRKSRSGIVFCPKASAVYPEGFDTWVAVAGLTQTLEGKSRPDHFKGVTTVVAKLFNMVRPDVVVFGMKDYQQAIVLRKMSADLNYPVKFVIAPTMREADGLAMSSRNSYFTDEQRWEAVCLYYALKTAREMVAAGVAKTREIQQEMIAVIKATCATAEIDYIAFTDLESLAPVSDVVRDTVCSLAVRVHGVRLIDNLKLK